MPNLTADLQNVPPQNLDAEKSFLCACFIDNKIIRKAKLRPVDFYREKHAAIWSSMQDLANQGDEVDLISLMNAVKVPASQLAEIHAFYPSAANWKVHQKLILEASQKRRVIHLLYEAYTSTKTENVEQLIHSLRMRLSEISRNDSVGIVSYKDVITEAFGLIEHRAVKGAALSGITTGFQDIDALTDGWQPGELVVIAARPAMGKTAFAKMSATAAAKNEYPAGMVHLEMGKTQLGIRAIAGRSGIHISRLRRGMVGDNDWPIISSACSYLSTLPIHLAFSAYTDREISHAIDNMVFDKGCRIIFVDYLQLATSEDQGKNREQEVSGISRMLKLKAKEHNVPVIALAQLNRQCEMRTDKRPMLADLRESGAIEQDADVIAFIYRDEVYNAGTKDIGIAEIIFRKGRQIELDTIKLQWSGQTTSFYDLEYAHSQTRQYAD